MFGEQDDWAVYHNRWIMLFVAVGSFGFVAVCPALLRIGLKEGESSLVTMIIIIVMDLLFFGSAFLWAFRCLRDRKPALMITRAGITDDSSMVSGGLIKWTEIKSIRMEGSVGQLLLIDLHDPKEFLHRQPAWKRYIMWSNRLFLGTQVCIVTSVLPVSTYDLLSRMESHMKRCG